jgi:hypothetical protein
LGTVTIVEEVKGAPPLSLLLLPPPLPPRVLVLSGLRGLKRGMGNVTNSAILAALLLVPPPSEDGDEDAAA